MTALMDQECQLHAGGGGVYERDCGRVWWGWEAQHGGYVLALAMTAMGHELGDDMELQHITVHYMRPFTEGAFRAEVQVERTGRTMANATARMWSAGKLCGLVLASFARRRPVSEFTSTTPPAVAPFDPDEAPTVPSFHVPPFDRVHMYERVRELSGDGTARVGGWVVPRTPELVDHRWVGFLVDLWTPVAYHLWTAGAVAQSVDLTYHARASLPRADLPPASPLLVVLSTRASAGGFVDEDVEVWSPAGDLLATSRQMRFVHG
jgi:hypothetical protein